MDGRRKPHFLQDDRGFYTTSYGPFVLRSAFQPIFSQDAQGHLTIEAFEALIRANRGSEPVSPGQFFSSVEPADAIHIDTICRELHILNMGRMGRKKARLFINLNPGLFDAVADIGAEVERMVEVALRAGLRPGRIVCEITEQGSGDATVLDRLVKGLRSRLFKIAVDDFGADDSDTERVDELKPDILKFDAAWVRRFTDTSAGMGLLKLMVEQFQERGIIVLFEGLEEDHQVDFCQQIGVQLMQGYALARPEIVPTSFNERFPEAEPDLVTGGARPAAAAPDHGEDSPPSFATGFSPRPYPQRRPATFGKRVR